MQRNLVSSYIAPLALAKGLHPIDRGLNSTGRSRTGLHLVMSTSGNFDTFLFIFVP